MADRKQYQQFPVEQAPPPYPEPSRVASGAPPAFPTHSPMSSNQQSLPPPSGFRLPLQPGQPIPHEAAGPPPFRDADGSAVFIGSALMTNPDAVHPCKIVPQFSTPARVPYGGGEHEHQGRYDLLPFHPEQMEWIRTSNGRIPQGCRPVEGGYEQNGAQLYHAYGTIEGVDVPGKTGEHLGGANFAFGGREHAIQDGYHILVWRH